jgi:3-oxoacyl-[acyl-carrier protein] reductase
MPEGTKVITTTTDVLSFINCRVIVMGGSRGIGRAVALGFAQRGARVAVCARGEAGLLDIRNELAEYNGVFFVAACDVGQSESITTFVEAAQASLGGIDVLVNCASAFATTDDDAGWSASIAVDLMGSVKASQLAVPYLKASTRPSIINMSSIAALQATHRRPAYGAMKAAIIHQTAANAKLLAPHGIRVNCVIPGSTDFEDGIWQRIRRTNPAQYETTRDSIPLGRFATPEDIAKVVFFLASPDAGWITGQSIVVDGGQTLNGA